MIPPSLSRRWCENSMVWCTIALLMAKRSYFSVMVQLLAARELGHQRLQCPKEHHMPYINVNGVNLYCEEYGKGPAVILTPGGRVDCNGLRPMAALLSPKCRVIL